MPDSFHALDEPLLQEVVLCSPHFSKKSFRLVSLLIGFAVLENLIRSRDGDVKRFRVQGSPVSMTSGIQTRSTFNHWVQHKESSGQRSSQPLDTRQSVGLGRDPLAAGFHWPRRGRVECCAGSSNNNEEDGDRPWWQRPPTNWPPEVDDPALVFGDVAVMLACASLLPRLTGLQGDMAITEGWTMASAWLLAGAFTNAWDRTATLPSLGLDNVIQCVARAGIDFMNARLLLALFIGVASGQAVDISLLAVELASGCAAVATWRSLYMYTSKDQLR